jgi:hypothetical protein
MSAGAGSGLRANGVTAIRQIRAGIIVGRVLAELLLIPPAQMFEIRMRAPRHERAASGDVGLHVINLARVHSKAFGESDVSRAIAKARATTGDALL